MKYLLSSILFFTALSCFSQVTPPPPPPPPPPPKAEAEVFKVVEDMPRFPGCEDQDLSGRDLSECARTKMLEYISKNLIYPEEAKKNNVTGMAVIQFRVEKNGTLGDIKIVRDPGAGTGEAANAVVNKMNEDGIVWTPGKQRGRAVVVQYTLPVKFSTEEK